jgi:diguanylate cyclase (GGDEF)-like protein/PAS domain S-box-containing protein
MADKPGATVLVVDDAPENIALLSRILKKSGYSILAADNGTQALDIARTMLPDIILLDVIMPVMDGFEACAQLKKDERTREIPVIFISALDNIEDKSKAFLVGGVDYILKPFEYEEVQARVSTHLILRRLRVQLEQANQALATRVEELTDSRELLAERGRRLSAFVSALPNLSFVMDEQGRYLEIITNETNLLAARPDELIGHLIGDVLPPREGAKILDAIERSIQTGKVQVIEYKLPVLSGGERWFEGRIALMEKGDPGKSKVVLMASDITERVKLYQEVQRLADQDVLTGCFNRRHFMELAAKEIQRSMRYKKQLSFLMMDIDHFKNVNDQYGHQIGDQVLRHLVILCQEQLRNLDILGRYGGEEFVVLMPETTTEGAMLASERLREKIEKMKINTPEGNLSITVSMGLTSLDRGFDETHTLDALIKSADKALYAAKDAGRNCLRKS